MQFTCKGNTVFAISDTHGFHCEVLVPDGVDIIIHCGDACNDGDNEQLIDFFKWFSELPITYKIFVSGNHDLPFDLDVELAMLLLPDNVIYLDNCGVTICGLNIYSLAARPWLHKESIIPPDIDLLLTHGAAQHLLDNGIGCVKLRDVIQKYKPAIHIFGHIHQQGNRVKVGTTISYNVAYTIDKENTV